MQQIEKKSLNAPFSQKQDFWGSLMMIWEISLSADWRFD